MTVEPEDGALAAALAMEPEDGSVAAVLAV
jgi:hypothetical protein